VTLFLDHFLSTLMNFSKHNNEKRQTFYWRKSSIRYWNMDFSNFVLSLSFISSARWLSLRNSFFFLLSVVTKIELDLMVSWHFLCQGTELWEDLTTPLVDLHRNSRSNVTLFTMLRLWWRPYTFGSYTLASAFKTHMMLENRKCSRRSFRKMYFLQTRYQIGELR